ncbi:8903_t:CDS:2 [Paraglomus brasilianum]|uniref:8903_t:CDS:1 n=1 Tax=Paraglomus brasilianum TaxID=144538 RepID=A0A9N8Z9I3_9GLOM|nr:8903_t:CDS:2 [Paraglomus brasilianum]
MPMLTSPMFMNLWMGPKKQARKERYHEKLAFQVKDIIMGEPVTKDNKKKRAVKALQRHDTAMNIVNILKSMPDPTATQEEQVEEVEKKGSTNDVNSVVNNDNGNVVTKKSNHSWFSFMRFNNTETKTTASSETSNSSENPGQDSRVISASAEVSVTQSSNSTKLVPKPHFRPSETEISVHIFWWGYEIYVPTPCMGRLNQAQNVSQAFIGFIRSIAGSVTALTPYWGFISAWVGLQFSIIKMQDNGHGVVIAATWVLPIALIPRPWDVED